MGEMFQVKSKGKKVEFGAVREETRLTSGQA